MNDNTQGQDIKVSARRRLIRGAFAVPAVMTLQSGSALAASSAANCLVKRNLSVITEGPVASDDSIFRYRLWVFKHISDSTLHPELGLWIVGSELDPFMRNSQTPFLTNGQWQMFDTMNNLLVGSPQVSAPTAPHAGQDIFVKEGPFISLRVNSTGDLVGAGASGGGSAVSDSCWNSFALATPP